MKRINKTSQAGWKSGLGVSGGPDANESPWKAMVRNYRQSDNVIDRREVSETDYINSIFDRFKHKDQSRIPNDIPDFPSGNQKTGGDPYIGGDEEDAGPAGIKTRKVDPEEAVRRTHTNRK